jgi:hypothetical protein
VSTENTNETRSRTLFTSSDVAVVVVALVMVAVAVAGVVLCRRMRWDEFDLPAAKSR